MPNKVHDWTLQDDIVALYLYRYGNSPYAPSVKNVARRRGMSEASLLLRIQNFKAIDTGSGLPNSAAQSRAAYSEHGQLSEPELRKLAFPPDQ